MRFQYLVDNAFTDLARPMVVYRDWFQSCGFVYACPQALVPSLAERGVGEDEFHLFIDEARLLVSEIVARCAQEGRHVVQVDTDAADDTFDAALRLVREPGPITAYRVEAPERGSLLRGVWIADEIDH